MLMITIIKSTKFENKDGVSHGFTIEHQGRKKINTRVYLDGFTKELSNEAMLGMFFNIERNQQYYTKIAKDTVKEQAVVQVDGKFYNYEDYREYITPRILQ